jgi:hypothetical protein
VPPVQDIMPKPTAPEIMPKRRMTSKRHMPSCRSGA